VGGLDSPNISTELRSQTRNLSVGHDDPFERESVGRNSADIGPYKDSWLALDPHEAAVCLRHLTQMLRLMRFDDLLADNGVEPVTGEARQRGRSASHHTRRKRIMGVGEVPSVSDVSTQPQEGDVVTGGNATFGQEQFWKLLAAVEASAENCAQGACLRYSHGVWGHHESSVALRRKNHRNADPHIAQVR
jgi:hypothetical protein